MEILLGFFLTIGILWGIGFSYRENGPVEGSLRSRIGLWAWIIVSGTVVGSIAAGFFFAVIFGVLGLLVQGLSVFV